MTNPSDLLRTARMLRTQGFTAQAEELLRVADGDATEEPAVIVDETTFEQDDSELYDHEVHHYLKWLGEELHPMLDKLLKRMRLGIAQHSETRTPDLVLKGVIESLKAYGFVALTGRALPYRVYSANTLPKSSPALPVVTLPKAAKAAPSVADTLRAQRQARTAARERLARTPEERREDLHEDAPTRALWDGLAALAHVWEPWGYRMTSSRGANIQFLFKDTDLRVNAEVYPTRVQLHVTSDELQNERLKNNPHATLTDGSPVDPSLYQSAADILNDLNVEHANTAPNPEAVVRALGEMRHDLDVIETYIPMAEASSER